MSMRSSRETARIYPFVPRARTASPMPREEGSVAEIRPQVRLATVACGSGWYHEAAIEAERAQKP